MAKLHKYWIISWCENSYIYEFYQISNFSYRSENQNAEHIDEQCISSKLHNQSFKNNVDDELFKEAKSVEHVQNSKHHEKPESLGTQPEVSQNGESKSK